MEKTLTIDGKQVRFKANGATPLRFKAQFGKDYFKEILKLLPMQSLAGKKPEDIEVKDLEALDFEVFYNMAWILAKTADPSIPEPIAWLEQFDEFPMVEIIPDLQELITSSFSQLKKK